MTSVTCCKAESIDSLQCVQPFIDIQMSDDIDCDKCDNKTTSLPQAEVIVAQIYFINIELKADVLL